MKLELTTPAYLAPFGEIHRNNTALELLDAETVREGRAKAEANGWHATYATSGDMMIVAVFYRGGRANVYDCRILRYGTLEE